MKELAALGDPTRQRIVEILAAGELSAGEIAEHFNISVPAISQHLHALREASLVLVRVEGNRRIYQLNQDGLDQAAEWLNHVRRFWAGKLATMERNLDLPTSTAQANKGPANTGSANAGSANKGSANKGSANKGSVKKGSPGKGSANNRGKIDND